MSLPSPVTIVQQANLLGLAMARYAATRGAGVYLAASERHFWENCYLLNQSQPRLILTFRRERPTGTPATSPTMHRVERQWRFAVMRATGWKSQVAEPVGDAEAFLKVAEDFRDAIRVVLNVSEIFPLQYDGMDTVSNVLPYAQAGVFHDGYTMDFTTTNDIPAVSKENPNPSPPDP